MPRQVPVQFPGECVQKVCPEWHPDIILAVCEGVPFQRVRVGGGGVSGRGGAPLAVVFSS